MTAQINMFNNKSFKRTHVNSQGGQNTVSNCTTPWKVNYLVMVLLCWSKLTLQELIAAVIRIPPPLHNPPPGQEWKWEIGKSRRMKEGIRVCMGEGGGGGGGFFFFSFFVGGGGGGVLFLCLSLLDFCPTLRNFCLLFPTSAFLLKANPHLYSSIPPTF